MHITFANYIQNFIQHRAVNLNSICRGSYGDFDGTGQLLIIYFAFIKYLRKVRIQWSSASAIYRPQESLWFK